MKLSFKLLKEKTVLATINPIVSFFNTLPSQATRTQIKNAKIVGMKLIQS